MSAASKDERPWELGDSEDFVREVNPARERKSSDRLRMDWLDMSEATVVFWKDLGKWQINGNYIGDTLRGAVDAAMRAEKKI